MLMHMPVAFAGRGRLSDRLCCAPQLFSPQIELDRRMQSRILVLGIRRRNDCLCADSELQTLFCHNGSQHPLVLAIVWDSSEEAGIVRDIFESGGGGVTIPGRNNSARGAALRSPARKGW